jgi:hypothetical protein
METVRQVLDTIDTTFSTGRVDDDKDIDGNVRCSENAARICDHMISEAVFTEQNNGGFDDKLDDKLMKLHKDADSMHKSHIESQLNALKECVDDDIAKTVSGKDTMEFAESTLKNIGYVVHDTMRMRSHFLLQRARKEMVSHKRARDDPLYLAALPPTKRPNLGESKSEGNPIYAGL